MPKRKPITFICSGCYAVKERDPREILTMYDDDSRAFCSERCLERYEAKKQTRPDAAYH